MATEFSFVCNQAVSDRTCNSMPLRLSACRIAPAGLRSKNRVSMKRGLEAILFV
jgi:hypothetical protein